MTDSQKTFSLGVVEGFFGSSWSWQARRSYANFLSEQNFNAYLYAPKNDVYLRKNWQQAFPQSHKNQLASLSDHYKNSGLDFGIGLSPFELYRDFNAEKKTALKNKLSEINEIKPTTLSILFDDMRGDFSNLAQQQVEIMNYVAEHADVSNIIMCPTYYSNDPALSAHFGAPPKNYLADLGQNIDSKINIFWTGPKVISREYPTQHLKSLEETLQRKVTLWDNYPVNDAKSLTNFLHLQPPEPRQENFKNLVNGHYANPMNQAYLSQLALYALSQQYEENNSDDLFKQACTILCEKEFAQLLINDIELFQEAGLNNMSANTKAMLLTRYAPFISENPMAEEIVNWLNGQYQFDPACLT